MKEAEVVVQGLKKGEVQTLLAVSPLHTWQVAALSGFDCWSAVFRKLLKWPETPP